MTIAERNWKQASLVTDAVVELVKLTDGPVTVAQTDSVSEWVIRFRMNEAGSRAALRVAIPNVRALSYRVARHGTKVFQIESPAPNGVE